MNGDVKILDSSISRSHSRVIDYIELTKPELTLLSVVTTLCGFYLGSKDGFNLTLFLHTAFATAALGGGVGALNQYIEREYDGLMKRTERRPLPSGRLQPGQVLFFGTLLSAIGILDLAIFTNPLTGILAVATFVSYIFVYTPLKRVTPLSTIIGGIPGGLPPMMGWTAARNSLDAGAWVLFAILFCWQMPHFLSLAWMYRKDYERGGFKMLAVVDTDGKRTARHTLLFTLLLIPASMLTSYFGVTGLWYFVSAIVLGVGFISVALMTGRYAGNPTPERSVKLNLWSRRLFFASLIYLPLLMIFMSLSKRS